MMEATDQKPKKTPKQKTPKNQAKAKEDSSLLGITVKKADSFSEWYSQVITRSDFLDYYDVSGCYILRPNVFYIWETLQEEMNRAMRSIDCDNCYFPMFVNKKHLEAEQAHVEGFSAEVAWVTKYSNTDLAEPVAIRPTSETIMYPAFSKWIRSHRDLPLKLNQWCPIVRWEFKQPTPFIRTREFLWQEGHTAHATDEEAYEQMHWALDLYHRVYEELLAVPVVKGYKSEEERFPGGKVTSTVEAYVAANGRSIQAATSHHLGTNFSKMFDIQFEDENKEKRMVHQTSWGITTRSIGVMIMTHGDDSGLVLPPKVAKVQAVVVPILFKDKDAEELLVKARELTAELKKAGVRATCDDRRGYTPGWKYNHWEVRGVPLRIELGPKDMEKETVRLVKRHNRQKIDVQWSELSSTVETMMVEIHTEMLAKAKASLDAGIVQITSFDEVMPALNAKKLVLAPWCGAAKTEAEIKKRTTELSAMQETAESALTSGMKPLCIPLEQPPMPEGTKCFWRTDETATSWCLFGRSY
ncbi:MAG: hypothetical protein KVP17_001530 [Porospora cf. gigantea B]|uniref:uncharacterized protein n=1 Tax=Porospora cf. gigantea B TaxID=2853592 RepID=UPI003571AD41|nr:MAG: hypothetical protein KVP17_001530 [Porospora cf. gigantea B]